MNATGNIEVDPIIANTKNLLIAIRVFSSNSAIRPLLPPTELIHDFLDGLLTKGETT